MSNSNPDPESIDPTTRDLIDDYIGGTIDAGAMQELQQRLLADENARTYFVRYCRLDSQLFMVAKASKAGTKALAAIQGSRATIGHRWLTWFSGMAALLSCALAAGWWLTRDDDTGDGEIAWLINAQNCQWVDATEQADLRPGRILSMHRGLAEIRFRSGATVILEGPASMELISANSAKLSRGKLTAKVPESAKGFQVVSPTGRVVDLGTEFGISVADDGAAQVVVFKGKVEAFAKTDDSGISVAERQAARIEARGVSKLGSASAVSQDFTRAIIPPPLIVPRSVSLDFRRPVDGTLRDKNGLGIGLTHRLPGTGAQLAANDANLQLATDSGLLELTTTRTDLNTQHRLHEGEYLGFRLADLGFTGREDFEIVADIPNIPALKLVGQFGLYAGPRSDRTIRGGLISYSQPEQYRAFLVNNNDGKDSPPHLIGLLSSGDDLRLVLRRIAGKYSLTVENQSTGSTSTLSITHPNFLDSENDLYVGIFGANPQSNVSKTLAVRQLKATVWNIGAPGAATP